MEDREKEIIRAWGTEAEYFKELETFYKQHDRADCKTFDSKGCLVGVTYYFRPYQVWGDNIKLLEAIAKANAYRDIDD